MDTTIIELEHLHCRMGSRYLLQDISWNVGRGEHWVVFGMNGSGKTTLLSIIAGFQHYTEGSVKLFGYEYTNENILQIRKKIGWVSSSFFDKHYTKESALDIVLSGKNGVLGLQDDITLSDIRRAKDLLECLYLGNRVDCGFDMFSKGERQNILIARALFSAPEILILDEPCTGLDVYNRNYLFRTIEDLDMRKDLTIIYVTHYVEEILPLFQNIVLLKNGRIFAKGEMCEIIQNGTMERLLGYPVHVINKADGTYQLQVQVQSTLAELVCREECENG